MLSSYTISCDKANLLRKSIRYYYNIPVFLLVDRALASRQFDNKVNGYLLLSVI